MPEITSRPETVQIVGLARFAIMGTLGLMVMFLIVDVLDRAPFRFLSESVLMTFVYSIALEVIAAIAAVTLLAWRK